MTEEGIQQVGVPTEPAEAAAGQAVHGIDRDRHGLEQVALDPAVAQLLGIQLRRIRRQPFELVVVWMGGDDLLALPAFRRYDERCCARHAAGAP